MKEAQRFLQEILQPISQLDLEKKERLYAYLALLLETNRRTNLTAITNWEEAVVKHLYDSLVVTELTAWAQWRRILDLGAGAGLPGIPLAIAHPQQTYYLLEASQKKAAFLQQVKDRLQLENIFVLNDRAETLAHQESHRGQYEVVTARAVAETAVLLELAIPFCQTGGYFVAYKGRNCQTEIAQAREAQQILGVVLKQELPYDLPLAMGQRNILLFEKTKPTPEKYPRRPGIPAKRPL